MVSMKRGGLTLITLALALSARAQVTTWQDTLQAAVKTGHRHIETGIGHLQTNIAGIQGTVSPMGEGDPIHWAQSLPGVSTGADGTTSMYVRGGASGNNLFSLDGIPVYGYSHILGLTTIVPTEVIDSAELDKGGFDGRENNFTSAHLQIITKQPANNLKAHVALNNFLMSTHVEGPIGNNLSYIVSARISPLTWEYQAFRYALPDILNGLNHFSADVGDVYGKLHWQLNNRNTITASILGSMDRYGFDTSDASHEMMGWHNWVGQLRYRGESNQMTWEVTGSANHFGSSQEQNKVYRDVVNDLSLRSSLTEYMLTGITQIRLNKGLAISGGLDLRIADFAPGQLNETSNCTNILLASLWAQMDYMPAERLAMKTAIRAHHYRNFINAEGRFDPEGSLSFHYKLTPWLSLELTGDRMIQYYHTLEGLPLGWSLDMMVPSGEKVVPEVSLQGNVGMITSFGNHSVSLGGYFKQMDHLVYYKYAQTLFSGALNSWEDHVDIGKGTAYGAELLYEYQGYGWYARCTYTLSRTTRHGFAETNNGKPFHARFDRAHILNAIAQWKGVTVALILQSGHWENSAAETYLLHTPDIAWKAEYYSGINNYHMPTVFRMDLSYQFKFQTGPVNHMVNLGVCNVTNHFNPFMLYFDARSESWKEIALLPILPNFNWKITF